MEGQQESLRAWSLGEEVQGLRAHLRVGAPMLERSA
jgi:hypothetical protein